MKDSSENYDLLEEDEKFSEAENDEEELSYAEAFELGKTLELPETDFEKLGFTQNPFAIEIMPRGGRHLTKVSEFWELAKNIGTFVKKDPHPGMIVYGPSGLGKSLFAKTFAEDLKAEAVYVDLDAYRVVAKRSEEENAAKGSSEPPEERRILDISKLGAFIASSKAKLILMDHIDVESDWLSLSEPFDKWLPISSEPPKKKAAKKIVLFLSHFEFRYSEYWFGQFFSRNEITFLGSKGFQICPIPTLKEKIIFQLLEKRVQASHAQKEQLFSKNILKKIARHSLGLPLFALQLAQNILREFARISSTDPGSLSYDDIVDDVLRTSDHARAYNLFSSLTSPKMSETRQKILKEIALKSLSRSTDISFVERKELERELVGEGEKGKISNSTLTHHTQKLAQANLILARRSGNTMSYRLVSPIFHALEIFLHQRVWK